MKPLAAGLVTMLVVILSGCTRKQVEIAVLSAPELEQAVRTHYENHSEVEAWLPMVTHVGAYVADGRVFVLTFPVRDGLVATEVTVGTGGLEAQRSWVLEQKATTAPSSTWPALQVPWVFASDGGGGARASIWCIDTRRGEVGRWVFGSGVTMPARDTFRCPGLTIDSTEPFVGLLPEEKQRAVYLLGYVAAKEPMPDTDPREFPGGVFAEPPTASLWALNLETGQWDEHPLGTGAMIWPRMLGRSAGLPKVFWVRQMDAEARAQAIVELANGTTRVVSDDGLRVESRRPFVLTEDAAGCAHVVYLAQRTHFDAIVGGLVQHGRCVVGHSWEAAGKWTHEVIGVLRDDVPLAYPSGIFGSDGNLHVVYYDEERGEIRHAARVGGQWRVGVVVRARKVWSLSVAEVGGQMLVVWADGAKRKVFARLTPLSITEAEMNAATASQVQVEQKQRDQLARGSADWMVKSRKAAERGDAEAQWKLGRSYYYGVGVPEDHAEAVRWFRKAADQGHALAQFSIGRCYVEGEGVARDDAEGIRWFRKAANQGQPDAQFSIGRCYYYGQGVPEDKTEALRWFQKAAEQGDALAQFWTGRCYHYGEGVPEDKTEALRWFQKAAEQGQPDALFALGACYAQGSGVDRSQSAALEWFAKAGRAYIKDGRIDDASKCHEQMKALGAEDSLTRQLSAELRSAQAGNAGELE